jgi:hypothetical protein
MEIEMTSGVDTPQLVIVLNTTDVMEDTGVVGRVEVFGGSQYSVVIRPGTVILDGAATLSPDKARILSRAIDAAARLAENYNEVTCQSDGDQDIS